MKTSTSIVVSVLVLSAVIILSSCIKEKQKENDRAAAAAFEKRLAALEHRQREILAALKTDVLRDTRFTRSIRQLRDNHAVLAESMGKLKKDVRHNDEKVRALARVSNKMIDYVNQRAVEIRGLKRKFYTLWRATMGSGKTFKPVDAKQQQIEALKAQQKSAPPKETEKSRKLRKKVQEGMG
ncbi:MAG TPA: hypothetical protein P5287_05675 [bacterium]|nr:hypothetical protein [bacterium]